MKRTTALMTLTSQKRHEILSIMALPKELTTVTPISKFIALVCFLTFPFIGFLYGMKYQEMIDTNRHRIELLTLNSVKRLPTPTPDPTKFWPEYKNAKYGYSFKYPSSMAISEQTDSPYVELKNTSAKENEDPNNGISFNVLDENNLEAFMNGLNPATGRKNSEIYSFYKVQSLKGYPAVSAFGGCCGLTGKTLFIQSPEHIFEIVLRGTKDNLTIEDNQLFDLIISTLQV